MPKGMWICIRCHRVISRNLRETIDQHRLRAWKGECTPHTSRHIHNVDVDG